MAECSHSSLGTPTTSQINLRRPFRSQVIDFHIVDWRQVHELVFTLQVDRRSREETRQRRHLQILLCNFLLYFRRLLGKAHCCTSLIIPNSLELVKDVVASLTSQEQLARGNDVEGGAGSDSVEELDGEAVYHLFGMVETDFI
jgi:hypothetical protein